MINLNIKEYKNQYELNNAISNYVNNKKDSTLSKEEETFLREYTGSGGQIKHGATGKGVLYEYYTPKEIVSFCWWLVKQHYEGDTCKVLEPSCGTGRFLEHVSQDSRFKLTGIECDSTSSKIASLLYPKADIKHCDFESLFIKNNRSSEYDQSTFNVVIGNPPYGVFQNYYKGLGEGAKCSRYEDYFVTRGLDLLEDDGLLVMVLPSLFLNKTKRSTLKDIFKKCALVSAYRLPKGSFDTTEIGTDIVVLRKGNQSVYDAEEIETYFQRNPEHVFGNWTKYRNQFGRIEDVVIEDPECTLLEHLNRFLETKQTNIKDLWKSVQVDGAVKGYQVNDDPENLNLFKGKVLLNHHYFQGNIREKLRQLELEKSSITKEQYLKQKKGLEALFPKLKTLEELSLVPSSEFVRHFRFSGTFTTEFGHEESKTLIALFKNWLYSTTTPADREGLVVNDLLRYVYGESVAGHTKEENQRIREKRKTIADTLFKRFLTIMPLEDQDTLVKAFNEQYNAYSYPSYINIPIWADGLSTTFKGNPLVVKDTQYEGVAFLTHKGVGCLAFEVGVGKTLAGIMATVETMQKGWSKRPLILVPNSVYPNWIKEIKELFPNIKLNLLGNLSSFDSKIEDGTLSIMTHEGLERIGYSEDVQQILLEEVIDQMAISTSNKRKSAQEEERCEMFVGKAQRRSEIDIETFGFDHITVDEAHRFKNLFSKANRAEDRVNEFRGLTASASIRAAKLFMFTQYILRNNGNRNVFLLTATPFNNSPLEVYNMLSYVARYRLREMGLNNVNDFMETFVDAHYDWVVKPSGNVEKQQVVKGFLNAGILRDLISEFIMFRTADEADVIRPKDTTKIIELDPSSYQKELMAEYESLAVNNHSQGDVLKAIGKMRLLALSPHIIDSRPDQISAKVFVENSPKLLFTARAIKTALDDDPKTSQLVYFPQGKQWIPHFERYLSDELGIPSNEIASISSTTSSKKMVSIEKQFNEGEIKVLIGTSKISEGMNLNRNTSILYNLFLDWNPTTQMQVKGRIHRQGNRYKKIRIIYPVLRNSVESMMFQKLEEKTARINNIWNAKDDYISTEILNPEELKLSLITDPHKKARMFVTIRQEAIDNQKVLLEAKIKVLENLSEKWDVVKTDKKACLSSLESSSDALKAYFNKSLRELERKETSILFQMDKRNVTPEKIRLEIESLENELLTLGLETENLDALQSEKVKEFEALARQEQLNVKRVSDYINEMKVENQLFYDVKDSEVFTEKTVLNNSKAMEAEVVFFQPMLIAV